MGRFAAKDEDPDLSAAMFHEQFAADLGVKEAMLTLASIYFGLTHEVLVNVTLEVRRKLELLFPLSIPFSLSLLTVLNRYR